MGTQPMAFFISLEGMDTDGKIGAENFDGKRGDRPRSRGGGLHAGCSLPGYAVLRDPFIGRLLRRGDRRNDPYGMVGQ